MSWNRLLCEDECMVDREYGREMADTARVAKEIARALLDGRPLSVVALCDGESATLWAGLGFQTFNYLAGFGIPGAEFEVTARMLADAIAKTDIVCVPRGTELMGKNPYAAKVRESLALWNVRLREDALVGDSMVCWFLLYDMWLVGLLQGRRVLVVNNEADKVCSALVNKDVPGPMKEQWPADWIRVSGADAIILEEGLAGTEKALAEAKALENKPDICLVGADARAAHLITSIAEMHSIPVVELGSACCWFHQPVTQADYMTMHDLYQRTG